MSEKLSSDNLPENWKAKVKPAKVKRPFNPEISTDELKETKKADSAAVSEGKNMEDKTVSYIYDEAEGKKYTKEALYEKRRIKRMKEEAGPNSVLKWLDEEIPEAKKAPQLPETTTPVEEKKEEEPPKEEPKSAHKKIWDSYEGK